MSNINNNNSNNGINFGNVPANSNNMKRIGFHEKQLAYLCGKHALNNVLQEEKCVWVDYGNVIIGPDDVMDSDSTINLYHLCELYEDEVKTKEAGLTLNSALKEIKHTLSNPKMPSRNALDENGEPIFISDKGYRSSIKEKRATLAKYRGKTDDDIRKIFIRDYFVPPQDLCNKTDGEDNDGMLPLNIYPKILEILKYDYKMVQSFNNGANVKTKVLDILEDELSKHNCLGAVINIPNLGGHWTAIVKYRKNCITLTHSRGEPMYAYADSLQCSLNVLEDCKNIEGLTNYLKTNVDIRGAVFIYEKDDGSSYVSQAQKNRDAMNNNPLNRIKIDGGKRKSRKNMKKTKRSKTRRNK